MGADVELYVFSYFLVDDIKEKFCLKVFDDPTNYDQSRRKYFSEVNIKAIFVPFYQ